MQHLGKTGHSTAAARKLQRVLSFHLSMVLDILFRTVQRRIVATCLHGLALRFAPSYLSCPEPGGLTIVWSCLILSHGLGCIERRA